IDASRTRKPAVVSHSAALPSGVGEPARSGEVIAAADAVRDWANEPVTTPAQAGCWAWPGTRTGIVRRPFASMTAWPTNAAKPRATRIVPIGKRICEICASWVMAGSRSDVLSGSGDRGATGRWAVGRDDERPRFDLEDESAVPAGPDVRVADDLALGAADLEQCLVAVAARRPERVDQAVVRAIRLAGREDRFAQVVRRRDAHALDVLHRRPRLRDAVAQPGEDPQGQERPDDADHDEDREEGDEAGP